MISKTTFVSPLMQIHSRPSLNGPSQCSFLLEGVLVRVEMLNDVLLVRFAVSSSLTTWVFVVLVVSVVKDKVSY